MMMTILAHQLLNRTLIKLHLLPGHLSLYLRLVILKENLYLFLLKGLRKEKQYHFLLKDHLNLLLLMTFSPKTLLLNQMISFHKMLLLQPVISKQLQINKKRRNKRKNQNLILVQMMIMTAAMTVMKAESLWHTRQLLLLFLLKLLISHLSRHNNNHHHSCPLSQIYPKNHLQQQNQNHKAKVYSLMMMTMRKKNPLSNLKNRLFTMEANLFKLINQLPRLM